MKQSSKTGTIKTTNPQTSTRAAEIGSTAEDTTAWDTVGGNKIDLSSNRLALSTSATTTVTGADTAYPQLWNRAPTAWRSGSNLVIPAQGGNLVGEWTNYTPSSANITTSALDGFYRVNGDSIEVRVRAVVTAVTGLITFGLPSGFTADSTKYPSGALNIFYGNAGAYDINLNRVYVGAPYLPSSTTIAVYGPNVGGWDATDPFTWASGDVVTVDTVIPVEELTALTPYITLYDNVGAGVLSVPEATSIQAGVVGGSAGVSIPAGRIGEYIDAECSETAYTTTANTYIDVPGCSMSLSQGVWMVGYDLTVNMEWVSGTNTNNTGLAITDSSNAVVPKTLGFLGQRMDNALDGKATSVSRQTVINVTSTTTYKVRIRCSIAASLGRSAVFPAAITGGLSGDDNTSLLWAVRIG